MPIYDIWTPFEENETNKPVFILNQAIPNHYEAKNSSHPSISPDSQCFDVTAAWYNHPGAFTNMSVAPMIPHSTLLRHDQHAHAKTPRPTPLRHDQPAHQRTPHPLLSKIEEPEHKHQAFSSTVSQELEDIPRCSRCHLLRANSVRSIPEGTCSQMCADIAHERNCPDTLCPTSKDVIEEKSHENPKHLYRRHSLLYENNPHPADKNVLPYPTHRETHKQQASSLEKELVQASILSQSSSTALDEEMNPLEEESNPLEDEANPLEQESTPLGRAHEYEDPYFPGAEERLFHHQIRQEEWKSDIRVEEVRKQM